MEKNMQIKIPTIPGYFLCPISLDLMKDPVILSSGVTYDRESIEKWFSDGNSTCPVTRHEMKDEELIPNHALRRMIQDWCVENREFGIQRIPTPKALTLSAAKSMLRNLVNHVGKAETLKNLRSLAAQNDRNKKLIVEAGAIPILVSILSLQRFETQNMDPLLAVACEEALGLLCLLDLQKEMIDMFGYRQFVSIFSLLCSGSFETKVNASLFLEKLHLDLNFQKLPEKLIDTALKCLVSILTSASTALHSTLKLLFQFSEIGSNRQKLVHMGAVPAILELLPEAEKKCIDAALILLECLCACSEGRAAIRSHALAVPVLIKKLLRGSDSGTEAAINILHIVCKHYNGRDQILELGIESKVLCILQMGFSRKIKEKSVSLLRLLDPKWNNIPMSRWTLKNSS